MLAAAKVVTVTLTGPSISAVAVTCTWDSAGKQFQCQLKTPRGVKTGANSAYTITAYQAVPTSAGHTVPVRVTSETVYFK